MLAGFNAYVIEGHFQEHSAPGHKKRDFPSFLLDVIHSLIRDFSERKRTRKHTDGKALPHRVFLVLVHIIQLQVKGMTTFV